MGSFSKNRNKVFWDEYAQKIKNDPHGASGSKHFVELENDFIISELKLKKYNTLLDIGCGNGQRTILFSKYIKKKVTGIDYSEKMINEAQKSLLKKSKSLKQKITFGTQDVFELSNQKYDVIISCRCLINQPTHKEQVELIKKLHKKLNKNGSLIIAEISKEGTQRVNQIRKFYDLPPLNPRWHNLHINEKYTFPKIKNFLKIKKISRAGHYYFISRILNPAISFPKPPDPNSKINDIALKSERINNSKLNKDALFEEFGAHLLVHFKKI
jgi:ubiquinone/menaquinone biosynthesis C-methylase UbiE